MNFFRKKSTALVVAAALIVASTLISVNVKFGAKTREVTDGFYTGQYGKYHDTASPSSHLKNLCAYADGLITIADNYGLDTEEIGWDSNALKLAMTYSKDDIGYIYYCYSDLVADTDRLIDQLYRVELNERDLKGVTQYEQSIAGAVGALKDSNYNTVVRAFLVEYDHFPTKFLAVAAEIEMPEYFDYGW